MYNLFFTNAFYNRMGWASGQKIRASYREGYGGDKPDLKGNLEGAWRQRWFNTLKRNLHKINNVFSTDMATDRDQWRMIVEAAKETLMYRIDRPEEEEEENRSTNNVPII